MRFRGLAVSVSSGALDLPKREASAESPNFRGVPLGVKEVGFGDFGPESSFRLVASMFEIANRNDSKSTFMIGNKNGESWESVQVM